MNIVAQEARKRQAVVKYALRKGKSEASSAAPTTAIPKTEKDSKTRPTEISK